MNPRRWISPKVWKIKQHWQLEQKRCGCNPMEMVFLIKHPPTSQTELGIQLLDPKVVAYLKL
jgi:hypothetical protein